ncbi:hypothetical protein C900_02019 [Fulvivirga imtechensis AK7]|uniref:Uncharacterized protein n=1 Tax=Fulvivirga imtechensis AK7 TaxID=1237149 RepID=L8JWM7_9BACT|nr:hypothetical protein [Fulvivirga imtechensis]ELR72024.1 hypothetical protein C900_02019 [Fulvivirga imtechensis AK7]
MKICIVRSPGYIEKNIEKHRAAFIEIAVNKGSYLIFFSELSATGYEPKPARRIV